MCALKAEVEGSSPSLTTKITWSFARALDRQCVILMEYAAMQPALTGLIVSR